VSSVFLFSANADGSNLYYFFDIITRVSQKVLGLF
jgi:hypothetical protein